MSEFNLDSLLVNGHYVLAGGEHSSQKVECEPILEQTATRNFIARSLANLIVRATFDYEEQIAIVGVPEGANGLASSVSGQLKAFGYDAPLLVYKKTKTGDISATTETEESLMDIKQAVVIEDVITTGLSSGKVIKDLIVNNVTVDMVAGIWNRGTVSDIDGAPCIALRNQPIQRYSPEDCPQCSIVKNEHVE